MATTASTAATQAQRSSEIIASTTAPARAGAPNRRALGDVAVSAVVAGVQLVAQWLPARGLFAGATVLGYFFYYVARYRRVIVERRIALAFPLATPTEQRRIARDSYVHAGLSLLWFLRLPTRDCAHMLDDLVEVSAYSDAALRDFVSQVVTAKCHAIVTTGHTGMWEFLPAALASPQCEQWIVYRPLHQPVLDHVVADLRQAPQRHLVPDKRCFAMLRDVLQTSAPRAQVVGIVADQRASHSSTCSQVAFLGQPTHLATGAARLLLESQRSSSSSGDSNEDPTLWFGALLHNRAFYASASSRGDPSAKPFTLVLQQIPVPPPSDDGDNGDKYVPEPPLRFAAPPPSPSHQVRATAITQSYAHILEALVRSDPVQYLWLHDLWRYAPRTAIDVS